MIDLSSFNVIEYLQDQGIPYSESGKNVSRDWIGISCPFCGDSSNHCGINVVTKAFSCFRCGEKGRITKLIMALEGKTFNNAMKSVKKFTPKEKYGTNKQSENRRGSSSEVEITNLIEKVSADPCVLDYHRDYLEKRGFDSKELEREFSLRSCRPSSAYSQRILIPYSIGKRIYTFSTRDVSEKASIKYKHCPVSKSILAPKELLFNVDTVKDTCIVVEGVFDVFRIGKGSVATSGTQYTRKQLLVLSKFKRVFLLFDPEAKAQEIARRFANDLSFCSASIEIIILQCDKDPGDMASDDVQLLRKEVFGRIY